MISLPQTSYVPPLALALDIGSSSTRALAFDSQGRTVAGSLSRRPRQFRTTPDGASEDDAEAAFQQLMWCIDATLAALGPLSAQLGAVAMASYAANLFGADAAGHPITPVYTYADTRSAAAAAELRGILNEQTILNLTGCPLRSAYWPARLRWLQHTHPDLVQRVVHWHTLGDFALLRLFGTAQVSYSVASWSGLFNRHSPGWDTDLLNLLRVEVERLPALVDVNQPLTGLRPEFARRWPALANIPWFPALGDGAAANIGSGCVTPERIALTVGTTGALRVVLPATSSTPASIPFGLWCYRVGSQRALLGGATSEGGNMLAWLRRTLRLPETQWEAALTASEPDAHGLTVLPFLAGERSPGYAGDVGASFVGMRLATTPADMLRAGLEAVAYRFALIARMLETALPTSPLYIAGGGALQHTPAWAQICADVLGRPLMIASRDEETGRGAALLALEALGILPDLTSLPLDEGRRYQPNPAHYERYQAAIARQQELYDRLIGAISR